MSKMKLKEGLQLSEYFKDKIIYTAYLFVLIFAPPILPYPHILLSFFSLIYLWINYRSKVRNIFRSSKLLSFIKVFSFLVLYVLIIPLPVSLLMDDIVNIGHYISLVNRYGVLMFTVVSCIPIVLIKEAKYGYKFVIECIINAGVIEGLCSIGSFLSPSIKSVFVNFMTKFTGSDLYSNTWYITVRSYGFARTLVDVFGLGIALIAGIAFFYGILEKRVYIIYSLIVASSTLLNSRTGVLLYLISIACSFIYVFLRIGFKEKIRIIIITIACSIAVSYFLEIIRENKSTFFWITSGVSSFLDFVQDTDNKSGSITMLFSDSFWQFPDFFRVIIGTGHTLYLADGYAHSDVGYINDLWLFGIIGMGILYGSVLYLVTSIWNKTNNHLYRFSAVYILISCCIFNIKASVFGYNPGAIVIFLILFAENYSVDFKEYKERNEL